MSRTYRRRHAHQRCEFVRPVHQIDEYDLMWACLTDPHRVHAIQVADFHRDRRRGVFGIPWWFRHERNQRYKRQARHELQQAFRRNEWEDFLTTRFSRDACWYNW
jgi:hypothetical protein